MLDMLVALLPVGYAGGGIDIDIDIDSIGIDELVAVDDGVVGAVVVWQMLSPREGAS